jgi:hypothetical protein
MHSLEGIIALNSTRQVKPATDTRACSFLFSKDGLAVICHSARHRLCFRLSATATETVFPKNGNPYQRKNSACRNAFFAFQFWSKQGQRAVDAFIEAVEEGASLETAERNTFTASRPAWTAQRVPGTGKNATSLGEITARRKSGRLVESIGAFTWRHLHTRTK